MYRSILLPLDGSGFGEEALLVATTLAARFAAAVDIVHVHSPAEEPALEPVTPYWYEGFDRSQHDWEIESAHAEERYLLEQAQRLARSSSSMVSCQLLHGPVVSTLESAISRAAADLIVMATHGRGGLDRVRLGSVAHALLRRVQKPILLVRPATTSLLAPPRLSHLVIPLDGSRLAESVIPHALALGAETVTLLRIVPPYWTAPALLTEPAIEQGGALTQRLQAARDYLKLLTEQLRERVAQVNSEVVVAPRAGQGIADFVGSHGTDVLAMATHGRGGLKRLVLGSVADEVLRGTSVPVLLFRPRSLHG